jgi:hypothetical protein
VNTIPLRSLRPEWNHAARILLSILCADVAQREPWPVGWYVGGNYTILVGSDDGRRVAEALYTAGHAAAGHTPLHPDRRPGLADDDLAKAVIRLLGSPEAVLELDGADVYPLAGDPIRLRPSQIRGTRPPDATDPAGARCVLSYTGTPEKPSAHGKHTEVALAEPASAVLTRMGL